MRTIQSQWVVANMHHMGPWSHIQTAVSQEMEGNPRYRGFFLWQPQLHANSRVVKTETHADVNRAVLMGRNCRSPYCM